jgi:HlyD family secretion protein
MKLQKKWVLWLIVAALVILAAGGGYAIYARVHAAAQTEQEPEIQTATVTQGDIVLSALGSGTLMPASETDLVFHVDGTVKEVLVGVGDQVHAGDALARLDTTDLERALAQAEISLRQAQISLETAQEPPDEATIQTARDTVDQAAATLELEQITYRGTMSSTLVTQSLSDAQENYDARLADYTAQLNKYNEGNTVYWYVDQAQQRLDKAKTALEQVQQQVDEQVQSAHNSLASATDQYNQAQASLQALLAESDTLTIENLELNVQTAEMNLAVAQENLANATLVAPFDGVVTAVAIQVGGTIGGATAAITSADMAAPVMEFWVEEADMGSATVGNPVNIVFDALPDLTFSGKITRVEPTLVTVGSTAAVQIWASVDISATAPVTLFSGMNAEVEIIAGEARNTLLVPVEALRELAPGQYAVFVVTADGELELRPVTVGLKDDVNAEILSGLDVGDVVSAGQAETTSSLQIPSTDLQPGGEMPPDGGGFPGGGLP